MQSNYKIGLIGLFVLLGVGTSVVAHSEDVVVASEQKAKLFNPEKQKPLRTKLGNVILEVKGSSGALSLTHLRNGQEVQSLRMPNTFAQINSIQAIADNKALVLGMANSSVLVAAIVNINKFTLIDSFLAYEPVLSPNLNYLVFSKFYPPHGVSGVEDRVRIYDMTRTPAQNRPVKSEDGADVEVGTPIYPVIDKEKNRANTDLPETDTFNLASTFYWSQDSSKVVFSMSHGEFQLSLVNASITENRVTAKDISSVCANQCLSMRVNQVNFDANGVNAKIVGKGARTGFSQSLQISNYDFLVVRNKMFN